MTSLPPANNLKTSNDMTFKLKELLERRRKARAGETTAPATPIKVQTDTDAPIIILTALDCIRDDEFSKYF